MTEFDRDKLQDKTDNLELIYKAIEETGLSSKNRTLNYTLIVLEDYLAKNLETAAEVDSMRRKYQQKKRKQQKGRSRKGSSRGDSVDNTEKAREYQDVRAMEEKLGWNS